MLTLATKKRLLSAMLAGLATAWIAAEANAADSGAYVGGQLGVNNRSGKTIVTDIRDKNVGVAGRVFGGYQFTENFAAELGYAKFANTKNQGVKTHKDAVDLVGKAILPLTGGFNVYGKLGAAYYLNESINGKDKFFSKSTAHKVQPVFGVGAEYEITKNVTTDLSWTRIQKVGHSVNTGSTDFVGLGLSYHF